jgi:MFS family permease
MIRSNEDDAVLDTTSTSSTITQNDDDNKKTLSSSTIIQNDDNNNNKKTLELPDGGIIGWTVVFASFCIYVSVVGFQYVVGLLYNAWLDDLESFPDLIDRRATLGWACSLQAGTFLGGSMLGGLLIKRFNERICLWISALLALAGGFGASHATPNNGDGQVNAAILIFFFGLVLGCCCSFGSLTAIVGVQAYFVKRRGLATGLVVAGSGFGALIQGPLIQMAIEKYTWRGALDLYAMITATILILASFAFVPVQQKTLKSNNESTNIQTSSSATTSASTASATTSMIAASPLKEEDVIADVVRQKSFLRAVANPAIVDEEAEIADTTGKTSIGGLASHDSTVEAGATVEQAALLVSTQGIGNTVGRIVLGLSVDLFPKHKTTIISLAVLSLSIGMLLLSIPEASRSVPYLFFFMAICGSLGGSIVSLQPALIIEMVGMRNLALAQGAFNTFQAPFALMSAPTLGALRSSFGAYTPYPWLFVALISFIAFGLSLRITRAMNK